MKLNPFSEPKNMPYMALSSASYMYGDLDLLTRYHVNKDATPEYYSKDYVHPKEYDCIKTVKAYVDKGREVTHRLYKFLNGLVFEHQGVVSKGYFPYEESSYLLDSNQELLGAEVYRNAKTLLKYPLSDIYLKDDLGTMFLDYSNNFHN